jgi:integrase
MTLRDTQISKSIDLSNVTNVRMRQSLNKMTEAEKQVHKKQQATLRQQRRRERLKEQEALTRFNKPKGQPNRRRNNLHNERMWASRNGFQILKSEGNPESTMVFLLKHTEKEQWVVTRRSFNLVTQEPDADRRPYTALGSAQSDFEILSSGRLPGEDWYSIENYYEKASQFIREASLGLQPVSIFRLGFFFSLLELRENGFEGFLGTKNINQEKRLRRGALRRFVYELLGNVEIPKRLGVFRTQYQNWMEKLALHAETVSNLTKLAAVLADATDAASIYPGLFGELAGVRDIQSDIYKMIRAKYLQSATSVGHLRRTKHFSWIQIGDLNEILAPGTLPQTVFNKTLLGLTTGIRPEELGRLSEKPSLYLINGTHLNYKGTGIKDPKTFLISKTDQKVNVANLANPMLSLISRILLKFKFECSWYPENPFVKASKLRSSHPAFEKYPERSLRATCATMLAYCDAVDSLEKGRATRDLAAQRLGHINTVMVTQVYAPQVPSHIPNPLNYFSLSGIQFGEFWVTRYSTLWDAYLLKKFLEYYKAIMPASEFEKLKVLVEKEAREFQAMVGDKAETHLSMDQI